MALLFSYGTLTDGDIQKALFGTAVPSESAVLLDWSVFLGGDGYLFIKPDKGGLVGGCLLKLTQKQLETADLWEEVPVYTRETVSVLLVSGEKANAWAYIKRYARGEIYGGSPLGRHSKSATLRLIENSK